MTRDDVVKLGTAIAHERGKVRELTVKLRERERRIERMEKELDVALAMLKPKEPTP